MTLRLHPESPEQRFLVLAVHHEVFAGEGELERVLVIPDVIPQFWPILLNESDKITLQNVRTGEIATMTGARNPNGGTFATEGSQALELTQNIVHSWAGLQIRALLNPRFT